MSLCIFDSRNKTLYADSRITTGYDPIEDADKIFTVKSEHETFYIAVVGTVAISDKFVFQFEEYINSEEILEKKKLSRKDIYGVIVKFVENNNFSEMDGILIHPKTNSYFEIIGTEGVVIQNAHGKDILSIGTFHPIARIMMLEFNIDGAETIKILSKYTDTVNDKVKFVKID